MDAGEWYIEVNGRKVGPFTLDQVQGLLDDGEIRDYHQVTSVVTGGQWISVQEALQDAVQGPPPSMPVQGHNPGPHQELDPGPDPDQGFAPGPNLYAEPATASVAKTRVMSGEFNPPPRPELAPSGVIEDHTDPALSLFDALQVQREKRTTIRPMTAKSASKKPLFRVPNLGAKLAVVKQVKISVPITQRMFWTAVFAGLILGSLTFGVIRLFKHHAPEPSGSFAPMNSAPGGERTFQRIPIHNEAPRPLSRPIFTEPRHRTIPPPPPPAHMAVPPHMNPENAPDNNEPREEYPPRDENEGYPPQDNNGNGGARMNNPNANPASDGNGGDQQDPNAQNNPDGNAQQPQGNAPGANAPGYDQFQPVQIPQGQNPGQPQGQPQDQPQGQ